MFEQHVPIMYLTPHLYEMHSEVLGTPSPALLSNMSLSFIS